MKWIVTIFQMLLMMLFAISAFAQSDSLIMNTGEILVGEIKGFDEGVLTIETDYSDKDFKVEWDKVVSIRTEQKFVMISTDGERLFGRLISDKDDPSKVTIEDEKAGFPVMKINEIVFFKEVDDNFWSRVDLKLSAGYTLTKANNSHQLSGNFKTGYTSSIYLSELSFGIIRTLQTADEITTRVSRTEAGLGFVFFIVRDWFAVARSDILQSSEQKLNIRAITKGGIGHYIVKTNRMNLGGAIGAAWNFENYEDPTSIDRNSAEAFAALEYKIFDLGDLELFTKVIAYPSLTEKKRFRTDFDFNLEYEFGFDLFINLGFSLNYDNQPAEGASGSDYVFQTTIGWEL
jgi:hypothetical protein